MKAISLKQPYGSLVMKGDKSLETRTWPTKHRGDLLICASLQPHTGMVWVPWSGWMWCKSALLRFPELAIYGRALCVVNVVDCRPMVKEDEREACCELYPGAYAWVLKDLRPVEQVLIKGNRMLFNVEDSLIKFLP